MKTITIARWLFLLAAGLGASTAYAAETGGGPSAERAAQVLQRARPLAEQGNANAQYNMGVIYDEGYGVERDYAKAREWYKKAAAQNYAKAEHNLGVMYQEGHGVQADSAAAARWFKRAARHGEPAAQNNLSVMYARGEGMAQDPILAAVWAARAAQAGNASAITNLPRIAAGLPTAQVDGSRVNIRAEPTTDAVVLKQAAQGVDVIVLESLDDWSRVLFPSDYTLGWVADFLLEKEARVAASAEDGGDVLTAEAEPASPPPAETRVAQVQQPQVEPEVEPEPAASEPPPAEPTPAPAAPEASVDSTEPQPEPEAERAAIGSAVVNIRDRPTTNSSVLFQAQRGEQVTILESQNSWDRVEFDDGRTGWVASFLLI